MAPGEAVKARQQKMEELRKAVADEKKGIRADVVTLFAGGEYHLYTLKKYTDIRLVFAPEKQIAFYGGDPDNFEFPRYDLDMCFFRVYEDGKPIKCEHYLKWSEAGCKEEEADLRERAPRPHQPPEHRGRTGVPPRHRLPVPARSG